MKTRDCFLLLLGALFADPNTLPAQSTKLQVLVYDYTGLSASSLYEVAIRTQKILEGAGVSLVVNPGTRSVYPCGGQSSPRQLVIRVVWSRNEGVKNARIEMLGLSIADHAGGTYASVFLKPVEEIAADAGVTRNTVLAYAAAHEIGHLLLGDQAHAPSGLMKPTWKVSDFQAMAQGGFHFCPEQARELAARFGVPNLPVIAAGDP